MVEEVEVQVRDLNEEGKDAGHSFIELVRKMLLAGVGAVAMSRDESEQFVAKLVERGELAQKDAEQLRRDMQRRLRGSAAGDVKEQPEQVGSRIEHSLEEFLHYLNIPSKRDIDGLSAKIAQLAARIEELRPQ